MLHCILIVPWGNVLFTQGSLSYPTLFAEHMTLQIMQMKIAMKNGKYRQ